MFGVFPLGLMFLNLIGMVLFFIVVVMAIKFVVRGARASGGHEGPRGPWGRHWRAGGTRDCGHWGERAEGHGPGRGRGDQAMEHANLRLARGEITVDQYTDLQAALRRGQEAEGASNGGQAGETGGHQHGRRGGRAMGIARLRLASGEIGVDEFNALRSALEA